MLCYNRTMKKLLEWIDYKRSQYGNIVILLTALVLFTLLAIILGAVYALFIGLMYIHPNLIYILTLFLLIVIITKNKL
jgi:hypothetical protein